MYEFTEITAIHFTWPLLAHQAPRILHPLSTLHPTSVHVLVLTSGGNRSSSQRNMTCEPSDKGGVPPLTSTLPRDGAAGEPQVTGGSNEVIHIET